MTKPDVYIDLHLVLLHDRCVLMGERRNTEFAAGQYHVPAGHLEINETIVDGIIREASEETGIKITPEDIDLIYVMHVRDKSDRLSMFFTTRQWSGDIENCEPNKCAGWKWIPISNVPENTVPYAKQALSDILAGKRLGLFGW